MKINIGFLGACAFGWVIGQAIAAGLGMPIRLCASGAWSVAIFVVWVAILAAVQGRYSYE